MGKVKVKNEVFEALNKYIHNDNEVIMNMHVCGWSLDWNKCLNSLGIMEMVEILLNGYEVEETTEDKILDKMDDMYEIACTTSKVSDQWFANGFNKGIVYINEMLDLKLDIKDRYK